MLLFRKILVRTKWMIPKWNSDEFKVRWNKLPSICIVDAVGKIETTLPWAIRNFRSVHCPETVTYNPKSWWCFLIFLVNYFSEFRMISQIYEQMPALRKVLSKDVFRTLNYGPENSRGLPNFYSWLSYCQWLFI